MSTPRKAPTIVLALLTALIVASPAGAAPSQETVFDATNDLLYAPSPESRAAVLDELDALGVDVVRVVVPWRGVVPSPDASQRPAGFDPADPAAYEGNVIEALDQVVRGAESRGMRLLLSPSAPIPHWASASGRSSLASPKPSEFSQLLTGLGLRYDGTFGGVPCVPVPPPLEPGDCAATPFLLPPLPRVSFWSIWNEPNLDIFLRPQRRGGRTVAGALYRELFLAGRRGLAASGHGGDPVLAGETSPGKGLTGTHPLEFARQALARGPLGAAGWAHHPYDPAGAPFAPSSRRLVTITALESLADVLRRAPGRSMPIYVTEYGVESVPDREFGVPLSRQADFLGIAEFLLWRNRGVRSYGQYLLHDDPGGFDFSFQTGLRLRTGKPKPAHAAFALPLVVQRRGRRGRLRFWGHVRPGEGRRLVQVSALGDGPMRRIRTNESGYFSFTATAGRADRWRASARLPGGRVLRGPWTRSYRFR